MVPSLKNTERRNKCTGPSLEIEKQDLLSLQMRNNIFIGKPGNTVLGIFHRFKTVKLNCLNCVLHVFIYREKKIRGVTVLA